MALTAPRVTRTVRVVLPRAGSTPVRYVPASTAAVMLVAPLKMCTVYPLAPAEHLMVNAADTSPSFCTFTKNVAVDPRASGIVRVSPAAVALYTELPTYGPDAAPPIRASGSRSA